MIKNMEMTIYNSEKDQRDRTDDWIVKVSSFDSDMIDAVELRIGEEVVVMYIDTVRELQDALETVANFVIKKA